MSIVRWMFALLILITSAAYSQTAFYAVQSGANEVPPNASTGWGRGIFVLSADQDSLYYALVWRVTGNFTASHIHAAPAGVNGGVVHALQNAGSAGAHGAWAIDAANLALLLTDGLYVNVHTDLFPGGEIRSQIVTTPFADSTYAAAMMGANEVPPNGSASWGLGLFLLSPDQDSLYYAVMWKLENTYTASHIHAAPIGVNGGVVHGFLNAGTTGAHGAWAIDALNLGRLQHDSLYANVHTVAFPGGEARGQILLNPPLSAPPPVTDLVILPESIPGDIHLFWSPSAGASQYRIYLSTQSETLFQEANFLISVADTHYVHAGAISDPDVTRFYGIIAESSAP